MGSPILEDPLLLDVVDPAAAPRVAAEQAPAREYGAPDEPVVTQRVEGVLGAARVVLALPAPEDAECPTVGVDEPQARIGRQPQRVPHARAFSRISSTRSPSQSNPRCSAASASP